MNKRILILCFAILAGFSSVVAQCYELVWADEFNYSGAPDPAKWTHEVNGDGGGNNELQYYTDNLNNSRVVDSMLIIEARKENYLGKAYTSARLISYNKASFKYGRMEARIKLPYGQGIWPAFWMMGNNIFTGTGWPSCGEIDIMEMIGGGEGRDDKIYGTVHWSDASGNHAQYGGSKQLPTGIFNDAFHVFSIEWTETYIKWFLDDVQYAVVSITPDHMSEFHNDFFILLNLAVGGNWPGNPDGSTTFPQQMWVDYVRVYQAGSDPAIEGPAEVIPRQEGAEFSLINNPEYQYEWLVPDGAEIISGQGTSSVTVNWGCSADTVKCVLTTPCSTKNLAYPVKLAEVIMIGENSVSAYQKNIVYQVPHAAHTDYTWILPEGVTSEKKDSSTIVVNWGGTGGTIKVMIGNSCGTDSAEMEVDAIAQLPYLDQPLTIPGDIRSVYFDQGGEGIAYHDTDEGNNGPGLRQDEDVDTEDGDGTGNIGWTFPGEWLEYSVKVEADGLYDIMCRTAGLTRGGSFRLLMNGRDLTGEKVASTASSWTQFRSMYIRDIQLFETDTMLRLEIINGDFNMANMNFTRSTTPLDKNTSVADLAVFPTIVTNRLHISNMDTEYRYQIASVSGKIIQSGRVLPDEVLSTGSLEAGVYILTLRNAYERTSKRFIKVRSQNL
ncbi:family 16 glycosylhydrolase [Saccharicrinis sp. FJH62]|uniref:family 16 glycosylhydrolase n=1 Tax=Saccharicrinis sp. FJH62 TaxID=3344657 RepID=UPI0035D52725